MKSCRRNERVNEIVGKLTGRKLTAYIVVVKVIIFSFTFNYIASIMTIYRYLRTSGSAVQTDIDITYLVLETSSSNRTHVHMGLQVADILITINIDNKLAHIFYILPGSICVPYCNTSDSKSVLYR